MSKLAAVVLVACLVACLVAAAKAQYLLPLQGLQAATYSQETNSQVHAPWAASASARSQLHGPDAIVAGIEPTILGVPAPIAYFRR